MSEKEGEKMRGREKIKLISPICSLNEIYFRSGSGEFPLIESRILARSKRLSED